MTPFEKAGYTKDTKFKVLNDESEIFSSGDIVTLLRDDGSRCPLFEDGKGGEHFLSLPGLANEHIDEELEVYTEQEDTIVNQLALDDVPCGEDEGDGWAEKLVKETEKVHNSRAPHIDGINLYTASGVHLDHVLSLVLDQERNGRTDGEVRSLILGEVEVEDYNNAEVKILPNKWHRAELYSIPDRMKEDWAPKMAFKKYSPEWDVYHKLSQFKLNTRKELNKLAADGLVSGEVMEAFDKLLGEM